MNLTNFGRANLPANSKDMHGMHEKGIIYQLAAPTSWQL